jgi:cell wall-associated NlpC family hydrolase
MTVHATDLAALVGVPYVVGGRTLEGLDCLGLVIAAMRVLRPGVGVPDLWEAAQEAVRGGWRGEDVTPDGWADLAADAPWRAADVLWLHDATGPNHLGIVIPGGRFLHTAERVGSCVLPMRRVVRRVVRGLRPPVTAEVTQ